MLIAEAVDTLITLGWALLAWLALAAAVASIALLAATALGWWAIRGLWRATRRPARTRSAIRARITARRARTRYGEAA